MPNFPPCQDFILIPQFGQTAWTKMLGSFGFLLFLLLPLDPVEGECVLCVRAL